MDEYIKREDALKAIDQIRCVMHEPKEKYIIGYAILEVLDATFDACDRHINKIPAADVAPKSEVERLEKKIQSLTISMTAYGLGMVRAKEQNYEQARKIFEEIEKICVGMQDYSEYAELKKKYTEVNYDARNT